MTMAPIGIVKVSMTMAPIGIVKVSMTTAPVGIVKVNDNGPYRHSKSINDGMVNNP
jgi:predicted transcriptional regulator